MTNYTGTEYANIWNDFEVAPNNTTDYRYYKFNFTGSWGSNPYISIMEIEMFEYTLNPPGSSSLMAYSDSTLKTTGSYSINAITDKNAANATITHILTSSLDLSLMNNIQFDVRGSRTGENISCHLHELAGGAVSTHSIDILTSGSWQHETWNISAIAAADRNAILSMSFKISDASADNNFNVDSIWAYNSGSAITTIVPGNIEVSGSFLMTSPNSSVWKLTIDNAGSLSITAQ